MSMAYPELKNNSTTAEQQNNSKSPVSSPTLFWHKETPNVCDHTGATRIKWDCTGLSCTQCQTRLQSVRNFIVDTSERWGCHERPVQGADAAGVLLGVEVVHRTQSLEFLKVQGGQDAGDHIHHTVETTEDSA